MRILKVLLALTAVIAAVFGGIFVVALLAAGGLVLFLLRRIFGTHRPAVRSQPLAPSMPRAAREDAIDVVATEIPAERQR